MEPVNKGKLIKFFQDKALITAVCLEEKNGKLHLLCETAKEKNLSKNRIVHEYAAPVDTKTSKDEILNRIRSCIEQELKLMDQVVAEDVWAVIDDYGCVYDVCLLAEIVFGSEAGSVHEAAVIRALTLDGLYFRLQGTGFLANTPEDVEKIKQKKEAELQKQKEIEDAVLWIKSVREAETYHTPKRDIYIEYLKQYVIHGDECKDWGVVREILKKSGMTHDKACFELLVELGVWDEDENFLLQRHGISYVWPGSVLQQIDTIIHTPADFSGREDFTGIAAFSVDDSHTRDVDDAISVVFDENSISVGIHITDVASFIEPGSSLDKEASLRATSLYLPEGKIPMIPQPLSENILSLQEGERRAAISFMVTFSPDGETVERRAALSMIKVAEKRTYADVDKAIETDPGFVKLYNLACRLREKRVESGAMVVTIPDLQIWVDWNKKIYLTIRDREAMSQVIVSELMIYANSFAATLFMEKDYPVLFRKQSEPLDGFEFDKHPSLFEIFSHRKAFSRVEVDVVAGSHSSLGVPGYTSITSPLRKYLDLITQHQFIALLRDEEPVYDRNTLRAIAASVQPCLARAALIEQERRRYWILKYIERKKTDPIPALVIEKRFGGKYEILLKEYLLTTLIKTGETTRLEEGEEITVLPEQVDPFYGKLKLKIQK